MHLRSIRLRGFKSFPDPVEVRLEPGVAVVVGPNGSGKSNIADAIVWAAGSLSPSELRAEKPDDVLFAGGPGRDPGEFGRVEQILGSKPADRRALIEEAAGLGRFKQRRHRAELKLARVEIQVERARDLEDEVRKRLRPLALQATAAERAAKLAEELERLRARIAAAELERLDRRLAEVAERRAEARLERKRRDSRLAGILEERRRAEDALTEAATRHEEATA